MTQCAGFDAKLCVECIITVYTPTSVNGAMKNQRNRLMLSGFLKTCVAIKKKPITYQSLDRKNLTETKGSSLEKMVMKIQPRLRMITMVKG